MYDINFSAGVKTFYTESPRLSVLQCSVRTARALNGTTCISVFVKVMLLIHIYVCQWERESQLWGTANVLTPVFKNAVTFTVVMHACMWVINTYIKMLLKLLDLCHEFE